MCNRVDGEPFPFLFVRRARSRAERSGSTRRSSESRRRAERGRTTADAYGVISVCAVLRLHIYIFERSLQNPAASFRHLISATLISRGFFPCLWRAAHSVLRWKIGCSSSSFTYTFLFYQCNGYCDCITYFERNRLIYFLSLSLSLSLSLPNFLLPHSKYKNWYRGQL